MPTKITVKAELFAINPSFEERKLFLESSSKLMLALGHPTRIAILYMILNIELTVNDIANALDMSPSITSHHLAALTKAKLVKKRRESQRIYYTCVSNKAAKILATLDEVYKSA